MRGGASADARARPPVLLLTGIGLTSAVALRLVTPLQAHFRVLSAQVGAGGNAGADEQPSVTSAEDAMALLDRADSEGAHIVGLSCGGVVAQEIAIRHPGRVRSLVLGSSTAGGGLYVTPERAIRQFLRRLGDMPTEEGLWAAVPYLYAETTYRLHAPMIGEDIARRLSQALDPRAYLGQHALARAHDAERATRRDHSSDTGHPRRARPILPLDNGRPAGSRHPGRAFIALAGGAHAFPTDVPTPDGSSSASSSRTRGRELRPGARRRNARAARA